MEERRRGMLIVKSDFTGLGFFMVFPPGKIWRLLSKFLRHIFMRIYYDGSLVDQLPNSWDAQSINLSKILIWWKLESSVAFTSFFTDFSRLFLKRNRSQESGASRQRTAHKRFHEANFHFMAHESSYRMTSPKGLFQTTFQWLAL